MIAARYGTVIRFVVRVRWCNSPALIPHHLQARSHVRTCTVHRPLGRLLSWLMPEVALLSTNRNTKFPDLQEAYDVGEWLRVCMCVCVCL